MLIHSELPEIKIATVSVTELNNKHLSYISFHLVSATDGYVSNLKKKSYSSKQNLFMLQRRQEVK